MKVGVFTVLLGSKSLQEALSEIADMGVDAVEIGTGGYPGSSHCNPDELLEQPEKLREFKNIINDKGLELSALSCHGNPLHPQKDIAAEFLDTQRKTVLLAEKLGIDRIVTFSGCPGDCENSKYPNWVTCPWPDDYISVLQWQWEEKVIPFWEKEATFAKDHGVNKICFEMHPGFVVYNPETLLKLRENVGDVIGANFDPSHLYWQGIDMVRAIRNLGKAIYYFHAKDTLVDPINSAVNGVLDTKEYSDEINRSWIFRTIGYGHGAKEWKDIISNLKMVGYNDVLSIEHEDSLMSDLEGLEKAVSFLKQIIIREESGEMWWA